MYTLRSFNCNVLFSIVCATLFAIPLLTLAAPAAAQDCQSALNSSTGAVALSNAGHTTSSRGVDEWDVEVVKFSTNLPGVIEIAGTGDDAQDSLYTAGSSSTHPLIDSATLATGSRTLRALVPAGLHCIQVAPSEDADGDYEVAATFTDVCHLNDTDDHGDSFLCATPIDVDGNDSGEITSTLATDYDMFQSVLTDAATITVTNTGTGAVTASLYDSTGTLLDTQEAGEVDATFEISTAGTYYVKIGGDDESTYGIGVAAP